MVEFIIGQSGSGKTSLMLERIKHTQKEVCIIVPEQYSYEFDKTLYFYIGADRFNELISSTFTGISRHIFQLFGEPGRSGEYADDLSQMIMIFQTLDNVRNMPEALTFFRNKIRRSDFADDVLRIINDLKRAGITPERLASPISCDDKRLEDKLSDIAMIYLEYERLMEKYGFKSSLDNTKEAAHTAAVNGWFKGKSVYIDEFESFSGSQLEMLRVIISQADDVTFVLRTDNVDSEEFTLFETVNNTYRRLSAICRELGTDTKITHCKESYRFKNPELKYLSCNILRNKKTVPENAPTHENLKIFEARDMYGEAEYVCASIKRLMHDDGSLKFRDIAILSNNVADYAEVLISAFKRYDIPYFMSVERPVDHTAIMVFFLSLLDLLNGRKLRSEQVFRLLKSGILDISLTDVSILENYCYKWNIDNNDWCRSFTADDKDSEMLEELRQKHIEPMIKLKKRFSKRLPVGETVKLLYEYLVSCGAEKNLSRLMGRLIDDDLEFEATELKRLWGCLIDILDSICATLGDADISFAEISDIMRAMISRITYSVPPQTLDNVIAASAKTARLNAPRVVFVMGASDGGFPCAQGGHGLFTESDKMKLAENNIEVELPLSEMIAAERLSVYKALSMASEKLFITYPLSDLSGQAKYPSPIIENILELFNDKKIRLTEKDIPPHYYAVTLPSAFYHYMQNRSRSSSESAALMKVLSAHSEYNRRISYVLSRSSHKQDYKIDHDIMKKLQSFTPLMLSPTSLDEYNYCHFKFFCNKCLRLYVCEKVELDPRAAGDLAHECFCRILSSRSKESFLSLSYDQLRNEISECSKKYLKEKLSGDFGKDAHFDLKFNKLTERLSNVFLHTQQSLMVSDFTPHKYELDLREHRFISLDFGGKYKLNFGGIIDRADICTVNGKEYLRIVDYKSKTKKITPETLGSGINLQMLLYLFSASDEGGIYENYIPAGVLYSPIKIIPDAADDHKIDTVNRNAIEKSLKTTGLVLNDTDVLDAMEKGIGGKYIPVKLNRSGNFSSDSSCISEEGISELRDFTYGKLKEMAGSLLEGDAEAVPLILDGKTQCEHCGYINICGNSSLEYSRVPDAESVAKAEKILSKKENTQNE